MRKLVLALACLSLTACDTLAGWFPPPAPTDVKPVTTPRQTAVVFLSSICPVYEGVHVLNQPEFAAAAVLIPIVVAGVVDAIKSAAGQAKDDLTASYVAYGVTAVGLQSGSTKEGLVKPSAIENAHCLIIARVPLGPTQSGLADAISGPVKQEKSDKRDHRLRHEDLSRYGWASYPSLYVEVLISRPATLGNPGTSYLFEPVVVMFRDTAAPNPGWDSRKSIGTIVAFSPKPAPSNPTKDDLNKSPVSIPFNFGTMTRGTFRQTLPKCAVIDPAAPSNGPKATMGHTKDDAAPPPPPLECPTGEVDVFKDQVRSVPGDAFKENLNIAAMVTESEDPTFFDKIFLDSVNDASFKSALSSIANGLAGSGASKQP